MGRAQSLTGFLRAAAPVLALALAALSWLAPSHVLAGRVDPRLESHLSNKGPGDRIPVIVELEARGNPHAAGAQHRGNRHARGRAVVKELRDVADRTQKPVVDAIAEERAKGEAGEVRALWIINGLATNATPKAIRKLAARKDVREVRLDAQIAPPRLTPTMAPGALPEFVTWNIAQIRAYEVWELDPAYDGTGIVIGSFDTGVDGTHPDLAPRYRGNHAISWFDPYHEHSSPVDSNGHGTHTTGTALGGDASGAQIGVAPGARWIAAKAWNDAGNATVSAFHQIFEWFLAPGGDPANAPHVINNSWGMSPPGCYPDFLPDLQAWRAAGIFSAFASGNDGPGAETILSPGNYAEAFAVGATDPDDLAADFSGQGPSQCDGEVKPDIAAPGVAILSALPGDFWWELDGTSMATPHISGAAAVLLSIDPTLDIDQLESALSLGAEDVDAPGVDNLSGVGRLDLLRSASIVLGIPMIGIRAPAPEAREAGTVAGRFTVTRTGSTTDAVTLTYSVSGSAVPGSDYVALPGSVTLPAGAASADIVVTPIDDAAVELDETVVVTLDASAGYLLSPTTATVRVVSDELVPDMLVTSLSLPLNAGAGIAFAAGDTTRNAGPGETPATTTRYYLSSDSTWDAGDLELGSRAVPPLAAGATNTGSLSVTIPAGTATGSYYFIARADAGDATVEISEANNTTSSFLPIGPDLAVADLAAPAGGAGQSMTLTDTTRNLGGGTATATTTRFYLSTNSTLDAGDALLGSRSIPALAPGATDTGSVTVTIPAGTATGYHYIIAMADGDEVLLEVSETNNRFARSVLIGSDLAVTAITLSGVGGAGLSTTVGDTTQNQAGGAAPASTTRYYLSANSLLDAADTLLGSRAVPALAAGAFSTGSVMVTIPAGTATGYYYLIAKADGDDAIAETTETNNTRTGVIAVGPDLVVNALGGPNAAGAGQAISVSDTIRNQGGGTSSPTTTRFYLSTNATLEAGDVALGSRAVPAIAAGASDTGTVSLTIPAGTATGAYFLLAKADGDEALVEVIETNNTFYRALTVGPDLVLNALTVPATAGAGASMTVGDTTANASAGTTPPTNTRYFLSLDGTLDAADVLLGSRAVPALAGGGSNAGSVSVTIPAGTASGTYYVIAKADGDDALAETSELNNLRSALVAIGPDVIVSIFTTPGVAGAGQSVTIGDTTRNQGGGSTPPTVTRYYLSSDALVDAGDVVLGSRAVAALAAGATHAGSLTVTIPAGTPSGSYYFIAKADADNAAAETGEGNNTLYRSVTIGPDLVVSALTMPSTGGAGLAITVSDTTANVSAAVTPATTTRFYLSANNSLDASDVMLGSRAVPSLAAGASNTGPVTLTLPAGTATGYHYLIAKADGDDAVAETTETNNTRPGVIAVGPDLVVNVLTAPNVASAGQSITVTDTVRNQGGGTSAATTTRFYLSANATLEAGDVALGSRAVPAIAANASDTGSVTLTVPAGTTTGAYYLLAKADGDDTLLEVTETNNVLYRALTVGPDLALNALTVPAAGGAGQSLTVSDTTANPSAGSTPPTNTRYYLSVNATLDGADVLLGSRAVPALAAGGSDSGSISVSLPAGTASGTYYVIARADGDDAVAETNELNNVLSRSIAIGPDLTVSVLNAPAGGGAGQAITVGDTTRNLGGGAAPASSTRYYLSTNATLDAADVLLGSRAVAALAAGASDTGSTLVTIPAGTATGYYYVIARADGDDAVPEAAEANNTLYRSVTVGHDLVVSALSMPSTGGAGLGVTVSDTTYNVSAADTPASTTRFYLSLNNSLDASDAFLGSRAVPALAAGTFNTGPVTLTIPAGTATGYYYLIAKADGDDAIAEITETNNTRAGVIAVGPDLVVNVVTGPASAAAGQAITVGDTTRNQGGGAAAGSTTRFYLSTNATLDGGDVLLGMRVVPSIAGGATDTGSVSVTIPAGTVPGSYYVLAKADGDDAVAEMTETNNTLYRALTVSP